jgi:hypothetical protein
MKRFLSPVIRSMFKRSMTGLLSLAVVTSGARAQSINSAAEREPWDLFADLTPTHRDFDMIGERVLRLLEGQDAERFAMEMAPSITDWRSVKTKVDNPIGPEFDEDDFTPCIVFTTPATAAPLSCAFFEADTARSLAFFACPALWRTVLVNSSSVEAVSSSELACSSVRLESCWLPAATWPATTVASGSSSPDLTSRRTLWVILEEFSILAS